MRFHISLIAALLIVGTPALSSAGSVQVTMHSGRVSLTAKDATLREILDAWARAGQTTILNADKVPGGSLTIQLVDVPEEQALDVLLRTAGGYLAVSRPVALADQSRFDRVVILPSNAPDREPIRALAPPPTFPQPAPPQPTFETNGVARIIGPDGRPVDDDQQGAPPLRPPGMPPTPQMPPASAPSVGSPVPGMVVPSQQPNPPQQPRPQP